jgi:SAM-dependent methyltransferase
MAGDERWDEIWSEKQGLTSGWAGALIARDIIHRTVLGVLGREIPDPRGKRILETGSGSGLVSLELAKRGADIYLLDLYAEALSYSSSAFGREGQSGTSVQASILDMPFTDSYFDITWSGGVIEHFEAPDQVRILDEMLRVTRPEGKVIVIAPWAGAGTYLRAKLHADRRRAWQPGYEVPIATLKDVAEQSTGRLVREYQTGRLAELHFLKYYFGPRPVRLAWCGLVELLSYPLFFLNRLPGYLLVSVLEGDEAA